MTNREQIVELLQSMQLNQTLTFPFTVNHTQIHIRRVMRAAEMYWVVEIPTRTNPYYSQDVQSTVDYLLQIRPLKQFKNPLKHFREETVFDTEFHA
ncbi:hypothetical protein [Paludifilum halophilum]|uniref:Uncharacterized protein n=1 Tax=Paludifilum halophilum TaxID=1642702 RepID=A0A235B2T0_9BACL|nr:hypothetical protein [Paludifilum halophilum]OYD06269.1 hypothetical protein CHM34_17040 [Paludifilum halophilum]